MTLHTQPIYADHNGTTPMSQEHWEELGRRILKAQADGNPASIHGPGRRTKKAVEEAREMIGETLGVKRQEIFFTSGATESNNWVIQTLPQLYPGEKPEVVATHGEHSSVIAPLDFLAKQDMISLNLASLKPNGLVDEDILLDLVTPKTRLVCLIHVHNETGVINPVERLSEKIREKAPKAHIHLDGVQSLGKVAIQPWLSLSAVDTMGFSAHKLGGIKGIGCLYKKLSKNIPPFLLGGSQELGLRSGTLFAPGAISFGICCERIKNDKNFLKVAKEEGAHFRKALKERDKVVIHGEEGVGTTVSFYIKNAPSDRIMLGLDMAHIALSAGSACNSGTPKPSRTLQSMGVDPWGAQNTLRVSFGDETRPGDSQKIINALSVFL
jgi:cysteine desulfurase